MRHLNGTLTAPVAICDAVTALALPPPSFAIVPTWWNNPAETIPEVDVEIWGDGSRALTALELFGAAQHPLSFSDITVTATPAVKASLDLSTKTTHCNSVIEAAVAGEGGNSFTIAFVQSGAAPNAGSLTKSGVAYTFTFKNGVTTVTNFEAAVAASADLDVKTPGTGANLLATTSDEFAATNLAGGDDSELAATAHGLLTGDGPFQVTSTGTIPAGLAAATDYYVVKDDADNIGVAATLQDALAGNLIQFTGAGTGTVKVTAVGSASTTQRVHWASHGLLGPAGDGVLSVDAQASYWTTKPHRPRVVAYGLKATFGSGSGKLSAAIYPVVDV